MVVSAVTIHTQELPLHCYLSLKETECRETSIDDQHDHSDASYLSAVQFLVEKHPSALTCTDRMGLLAFHVAAPHDAALEVLFYVLCQNPGAVQQTGLPLPSVVRNAF